LTKSILFSKKKETGIIHLNKPESLNALNLKMVESFLSKLIEWEKDKNIKRILLTGEGKAFCAGGDVKSIIIDAKKSKLKKEFFLKEYSLNYKISQFKKPYLSIWDGIVMGGGVGLSIYGNKRIATENSKFAMPETAIGFFPDVGGSYFLSRLKKNIGFYLALTGNIIKAEEMLYLGLATHYYKNNNLDKIISDYIKNGIFRDSDKVEKNESELIKNVKFIEKSFSGDIYSVIKNLENSKSKFAKKNLDILNKKCPMSLVITSELFKRAKKLSLKECLKMEFQLSQHIVYRDDFNNGVDAVLISKTYNPEWKPSSIYDITKRDIDKLFDKHTGTLKL
tara:strand:+ start:53 stop:1063 length:1011 start_codon:yes stop_codon:yes gene_type:complete